MIYKRIGLHQMVYCNQPAIISTVQLSEHSFETMVMFNDGEEIESFRTTTLEAAKAQHNETMRHWNDRLYEGSTARFLGVQNLGQFVKTVVAC